MAVADGLRRLDGVASVDVDLQHNLCTITPDPTRRLALDGVPLAVRRAGYRPGRMWILADGELEPRPDGATFTIANGPTFAMVGDAPSAGPVHGVVEFAPPRLFVQVPLPR